MQPVAFDVADGFTVEVDLVQVAAAVVEVVDAGGLTVVNGGFADEPVEYVVNEFDAAVAVAGFDQIAGQRIVVEADAAVVFALFGGNGRAVDTAAGFFHQLAEDIAFEAVDMPNFGAVCQLDKLCC